MNNEKIPTVVPAFQNQTMRANQNVVINRRPPNERPTGTYGTDGARKSIKSPTKRTSIALQNNNKAFGSPTRGRPSTVSNSSPLDSPTRRKSAVIDVESRNNSPVKRYTLPNKIPRTQTVMVFNEEEEKRLVAQYEARRAEILRQLK